MIDRTIAWLMGIDSGTSSGDGSWRVDWLATPTGDRALLTILLALGSLVALWYLYRWEAASLGRSTRLKLIALRAGVVACVIAMLAEPLLVRSATETVPSHLIVLVDSSESMGLRDAWRNETESAALTSQLNVDLDGLRKATRMDLAWKVLSSDLRTKLAANGDRIVHVHTFSEKLDDSPLSENPDSAPTPNGRTTAIGSALRQSLAAYRGMPLAGVLLVSDGQSNGGESMISAAQAAADEGVSIVALTAGTDEGPRNVAIKSFETSPVVFERDSNRVTVVVESRGLSDVPATVTLERRRNGEQWQEAGQQSITLGADNRLQSVIFDYTEEQPGKVEFRAKIDEMGAELTYDDNSALSEVRVIPQKLRVLLIAGSTFPEIQFLRNALLRDKKIELSSWFMSADETYEHPGAVPIRRLPSTQEELDQIDCVILYDPDPTRWPANFPELLTSFVGRAGGGLVFVAGEMQTAGLFEQQDDPSMSWLSLLPVIREAGLFRTEVQMRLSAQSPWELKVTNEGLNDPVFAFSQNSEENRRILESLPGMFWHFPVTRAKPGATVLAQHGDPRMQNEYGPEVMLATQLVGPGRTFFVGFDSTYRWRYLDEQFFDGFWARLIDRAGRNKQLGGGYPFRLSTDRTSIRPGSQVTISAKFIDRSSIDAGLRVLHGEIERGDDEATPITLEPGQADDEFTTTHTFTRAGQHFVRVWLGDDTSKQHVKAATLQLNVDLPNLEYESPTLDRARLEAVAATTGGTVCRLSEADRAAAAFKTGRVAHVIEERNELWNSPLLYATIFGLLLTEWLLRKRHRLI